MNEKRLSSSIFHGIVFKCYIKRLFHAGVEDIMIYLKLSVNEIRIIADDLIYQIK